MSDKRGMGSMRVGNAPVSWGVYEAGVATNPPFSRILDAIAEAGYSGTELGPYGYLPSDPETLRAELRKRNLTLGSSFVSTPLESAELRTKSVEHAMEVAKLLATQGVDQLMIAPADSDVRAELAGRAPKDGSAGYTEAEWKEVRETLHAIAREAKKRFNMSVVVHHHAATKIETPSEIDRLLAETDPELVNLLLDTGHAAYGGGGSDPLDIVRRHPKRIAYVHYKDVSRVVLDKVLATGMRSDAAWKAGIFCGLGDGFVDFPQLTEMLKGLGYEGWVIVEQDVVPDAQGNLSPEPFGSAKKSREYLRDRCGI
jgi:inosose dehydratase